MNLENPKKFQMLADQAHQVAKNVYRPISRKYDKAEHADLLDGHRRGHGSERLSACHSRQS